MFGYFRGALRSLRNPQNCPEKERETDVALWWFKVTSVSGKLHFRKHSYPKAAIGGTTDSISRWRWGHIGRGGEEAQGTQVEPRDQVGLLLWRRHRLETMWRCTSVGKSYVSVLMPSKDLRNAWKKVISDVNMI